MRLSSAAYLMKQGMRNIVSNSIMSFATFCIMTVSLLLIGFTALVSANINSFISDIEKKNEVVIFLTDDADDKYIEELGQRLRTDSNISEVVFWSKEAAFEDVKSDMSDAEDIFSYIKESPLPDSYRIKIKDISKMSGTLMTINSYSHIEKVKAPYDFVNVLTGVKSIITLACSVILAALIVVSFVIISNATRASVDIRKREISIMKFVGATNAFIKIPFFVEGLAVGTFAGVFASVLTWVGYDSLADLLSAETTLFTAIGTSGFIPLNKFLVPMVLLYIAAGAFISAVGTVFSTRKYVKV